MSTTDKTGAKLVDSMRKTKEAAAADKPRPSQGQRQGGDRRGDRPQDVDRGRSGGGVGGDPYQGGRRIWPD